MGTSKRKKCAVGRKQRTFPAKPFGKIPYKMGVINLNIDTPVHVQIPDEGWEDNDSLTEHLLGVILVQ